jgi:hypothetical protein
MRVYVGAWGVLSYEKMENELKLLFRVVSECLDIYICYIAIY